MSDYLAARASRPKPKMTYWPYGVGLVLVLAWSWFTVPAFIQGVAPYMTEEGTSSGRLFGYFAEHAFIQALVVWLLINLPLVKWQGPHPLYFFALLAAAATPDVMAMPKAKAYAAHYRYDRFERQTAMVQIKSAAMSTVLFGPRKETKADIQAKATGQVGQVGATWKHLLDGAAGDYSAYQAEIQRLGITANLAPGRMGAANARAQMAKAHQAIDKYRASTDARFKAYQASLAKVGAAKAADARLLAAKGEEAKASFGKLWAKEGQIIAEADSMIAFLDRTRGRWSVRSPDTIQFSSKADLAAWRAHQDRMRNLQTEERTTQLLLHQTAAEITDQLAKAGGAEPDPDEE